jgi:hypothetical protein
MTVRTNIVLAAGILVMLLSACDKLMDTSPEKLPARLEFEFAIDECEIIDTKDIPASGGNNNQSKFTIDRGFLSIENIEFDGRRQHGATNVYFFSDFAETVKLHLTGSLSQTEIAFDIPQGVYSMVELTFHLGDEDTPSLVMEGSFQRGNHEPVEVRFEYAYREQVRVKAKKQDGQQEVIFNKDEVSMAEVRVDTQSLVRLINFGMLMDAETVIVDGREILLINEHTNPGLYNNISARLNQALKLFIR